MNHHRQVKAGTAVAQYSQVYRPLVTRCWNSFLSALGLSGLSHNVRETPPLLQNSGLSSVSPIALNSYLLLLFITTTEVLIRNSSQLIDRKISILKS